MRRTCVGRARPEDRQAINALRVETYRSATEFRLLRPDLLEWDSSSTAHVVLAGWDDEGRLCSTYQGITAASAAEAERILGVSLALDEALFPTFITGRAATMRSHARSGLNSVLRWYFMRATIAAGFPSTMGLAYTGAPRLRTMFQMGYASLPPERVWDPEVEFITPPLVVYLPAQGYPAALTSIETAAASQIAAYPWRGTPLTLQVPP